MTPIDTAPDIPRPYRIVERHDETSDVVTLRVQPSWGRLPDFVPAQFSMIGVVGVGEVPISISSRRDDRTAHGFTLRRSGAVTDALWSRRIGDVVTVRGPFGRGWDLDRGVDRHVVVVAGGIGLAPLRAAVDAAAADLDPAPRSITLLVGASTPNDQIFGPWLRDLARRGVEVHRAVDQAADPPALDVHLGRVTDLIPAAVGGHPGEVAAFVCGPDAMMVAAVAALREAGVAAADIEVTLERNMQCANGWCGHCQLGPLLICRDGPVVSASELGDLLQRSEL